MILYLNLLESENDISKFELLYNTYKKTMFYIANEILKDECLAEDAVHE
ncbi:RNA polymerase subunit sigma-24, partial [Clostridioides difficile]